MPRCRLRTKRNFGQRLRRARPGKSHAVHERPHANRMPRATRHAADGLHGAAGGRRPARRGAAGGGKRARSDATRRVGILGEAIDLHKGRSFYVQHHHIGSDVPSKQGYAHKRSPDHSMRGRSSPPPRANKCPQTQAQPNPLHANMQRRPCAHARGAVLPSRPGHESKRHASSCELN